MMHYFVAANLWLLLAVAAFIGKTYERSAPTMYTVLGAGQSFYPHEYNMLVSGLAAVAVAHFVMHFRNERRGQLQSIREAR